MVVLSWEASCEARSPTARGRISRPPVEILFELVPVARVARAVVCKSIACRAITYVVPAPRRTAAVLHTEGGIEGQAD